MINGLDETRGLGLYGRKSILCWGVRSWTRKGDPEAVKVTIAGLNVFLGTIMQIKAGLVCVTSSVPSKTFVVSVTSGDGIGVAGLPGSSEESIAFESVLNVI